MMWRAAALTMVKGVLHADDRYGGDQPRGAQRRAPVAARIWHGADIGGIAGIQGTKGVRFAWKTRGLSGTQGRQPGLVKMSTSSCAIRCIGIPAVRARRTCWS